MRAILTLGYNEEFLINGNEGEVLKALASLVKLEKHGKYGEETFVPNKSGLRFDIQYFPDERIVLDEKEGQPRLLKTVEELSAKNSEEIQKRWDAERNFNTLKKKLIEKGVEIPDNTKVEDIKIPF